MYVVSEPRHFFMISFFVLGSVSNWRMQGNVVQSQECAELFILNAFTLLVDTAS